ncbi:MAG: ABC transporter ATP-binding protein, partial [Bacilli bacterium]
IKNYTKKYSNEVIAVDNISLTIKDGDICAFVGHNGAGKTTTLKSVVGILDFSQGEILINGVSIKENPIKCKEMLAYIPDNPDLYEHLKGIEFINFIADIYKVDKEKRLTLIKKYADLFEMTDSLGNEISSYSHGMKQKVAIIAALIHEPSVLVLDEPFVGLDPTSTHNLKLIMNQMSSEGITIFFSTHILEVAEKLCNTIAIIKKGKIIYNGTMKELTKNKGLEEMYVEMDDANESL